MRWKDPACLSLLVSSSPLAHLCFCRVKIAAQDTSLSSVTHPHGSSLAPSEGSKGLTCAEQRPPPPHCSSPQQRASAAAAMASNGKVAVDKLKVGATVAIKLKDAGSCEGAVYTVDPVTRTVVLFSAAEKPVTQDSRDVRLVPCLLYTSPSPRDRG